ncbi:MAG: hypothetical protein NTV88_00685, partial [Candidatus Micrarchaeota archaeon]|nr:hypothetical protein [Candidatus Micrarchaeota archaeon]
MTNSLDVVLCQPYLDKKGGAERVVLEIARHFNAPIYTLRYSEKNTFEGFGELEIRTIKTGFVSSIAGAAAGFDRDSRAGELASAGPALFSHKIKDDYDALSAHLPPSEWLRNKNERMCWYCHGTNAGFLRKETLLQASLGSRNIAEKALFYAGTSAFRAVEKEIVGKIEKICACSEITAKRIGDSFGRFDAEPIHPAVDYKKFGCGSFQKYFLCLSRMVPEKGLDAAINAFRIFSQKRKGWKLIIAGS